MENVEAAIIEVNDDVLPVTRGLTLSEFQKIKEMSQETAGKDGADLLINAINNAYKYGFWLGWRHCEVEMPLCDTAEDP